MSQKYIMCIQNIEIEIYPPSLSLSLSLSNSNFYYIYISIVPSPSMVITRSPFTGPIYESTNFNLTCTGTLPSVVDTTVSATVVWFDPQGKTIPVETRRMITNVKSNGNNEFESTLVFLPIDNGDHNSNFNDTGTYICQMNVSSTIL